MITAPVEIAHGTRDRAMGRQLLLSFIALVFALTITPSKAHAQITGEIQAKIPFQFHVGSAKLPPGNYVIHVLDNTDLGVMEIASADGSTSALFDVREAQANSAPAKTELIFNKYGNRYFLAKLYDEGNPSGSTVDQSRYEKRVSDANTEAEAHVPAVHTGKRNGN